MITFKLITMFWLYLPGKLSRRSFFFLVLSAIFICGSYWSARTLNMFHKTDKSGPKISLLLGTSGEQDYHVTTVSIDSHLKMAVDKLPTKGISPSALQLEDLYYIPNERPYESYNNSLLRQPKTCTQQTLLTVFVPSHPASMQEREVIRETWGSVARGEMWPRYKKRYAIRLFFILGSLDNYNFSAEPEIDRPLDALAKKVEQIDHTNNDFDHDSVTKSRVYVERRIQHEMETFDDIVQFDLVDSYRNLTRKLMLAFDWLVKSCHSTEFILKADQDVFVNIPLLFTLLSNYAHQNTIYGYIYPNSWVERKGKWAVDKRVLPIDKYPIYAAGNAYVMSTDAVATVLRLAPYFPYIPVEDAFITGILASVGEVDRVHVAGFTKWSDPLPDACDFINNKLYVGNNASIHDLRVIWWHFRLPDIVGC